jgi:NADPH:quinone reductase-like Zn-dependent oxidoreductase
MKAIVYTRYGPPDVLQLLEVEKPVPGDDEVLIRTYAATVTAGDCEVRSFTFAVWLWLPLRIMMGVLRPRRQILGQEVAGEIEAVGKDVNKFRVGDQVFATCIQFGAYAEYLCLPGSGPIALKPANMSFAEAATVPTGAYNALHFLKRANIQSGEKILINGAGGGIGVIGVQLAKHFGAHVTGVDGAEKLDLLRSIGADEVIDYTREDFTGNGETYDVIFDIHGKSPFARCVRSLGRNGRYLLGNPQLRSIIRGLWTSWTSSKKVIFAFAGVNAEDLDYVRTLIEAGKIRAVIDRIYPMEKITEAHTYVETGRKKGNVVITIGHDG